MIIMMAQKHRLHVQNFSHIAAPFAVANQNIDDDDYKTTSTTSTAVLF